jgi:excisionase family DNA binding protein
MSEPAVTQFRSPTGERRKLRAVRDLVDHPQSRVSVKVGEITVELPPSLVEVLFAAIDVLQDGDTLALVNEQSEVTPAQAAKLLGVSRQYVDRLIADDELPARRLPGSSYRKIPVSAVLAHRETKRRKRKGIRTIVDAAADAKLPY